MQALLDPNQQVVGQSSWQGPSLPHPSPPPQPLLTAGRVGVRTVLGIGAALAASWEGYRRAARLLALASVGRLYAASNKQ